jgi:EF-hand domain pair
MRIYAAAGAVMLAIAPAIAAGADKDGDGTITRAELTEVHASLFAQLDRNGDSVVDASEADPHFLEIADFNRDGRVTREENRTYAAEAAAGDLANCDANGDEALSGGEIACITSADSFE